MKNSFKKTLVGRLFPIFSIRWKIKQYISELIWPRQKWLTKKIPRHWCDKVELIRICLFEMIIDFVENEMDIVSWDWSEEVEKGYISQERADKVKQDEFEIRKIYHYIKHVRPALEKEKDAAYPPIAENWLTANDKGDMVFSNLSEEEEACYNKVSDLEEQIEKQDQQMMLKIVELRTILWT